MKPFLAVAFAASFLTSAAQAEVAFPDSRRYVGTDEDYFLDSFGNWETVCKKAKNGEDFCAVTLVIDEPIKALALEMAVFPSLYPLGDAKADVDVAPRARITINAMFGAEHYKEYSAVISKLDEQSFDGFWCNITDDICDQGPDLALAETNQLLNAKTAELAIYPRLPATENATPVATVQLTMVELRQAYDRAAAFNSQILDFDPEDMVETRTCGFTLMGQDRRISYVYDKDYDIKNSTLREDFRGPKAGDCPSYVALAYATADATSAQRKLFCLSYDKETKSYLGFEKGAQDAYGICKAPSRSFCQRVNASKSAAISIAGFGSGAVGSAVGSTSAAGVSVVAHSSGAYILTGTSGYIAGTLGTIGTSALAILTAPIAIAGAAVSVVAVGGAVYVCSDKG